MDFGYTPEQQQLRKTIRAFCEAEIKPHVMEWDESQTFPDQVFRKLGELGVLGAVFPEELGGYRLQLRRLFAGDRGAGARRSVGGAVRRGARFAVHQSHLFGRQRRAEAALHSEAGVGRMDWVVGA